MRLTPAHTSSYTGANLRSIPRELVCGSPGHIRPTVTASFQRSATTASASVMCENVTKQDNWAGLHRSATARSSTGHARTHHHTRFDASGTGQIVTGGSSALPSWSSIARRDERTRRGYGRTSYADACSLFTFDVILGRKGIWLRRCGQHNQSRISVSVSTTPAAKPVNSASHRPSYARLTVNGHLPGRLGTHDWPRGLRTNGGTPLSARPDSSSSEYILGLTSKSY